MVVRSPLHMYPVRQSIPKRHAVALQLLYVLVELGRLHFLELHGERADLMLVRSTLQPWKDSKVNLLFKIFPLSLR